MFIVCYNALKFFDLKTILQTNLKARKVSNGVNSFKLVTKSKK